MYIPTPTQQQHIDHWWPALLSGALMWLVFIFIGGAPILRATALAGVVVGISLALRRLGPLFAIGAGVLLGTSPAFWSQMGEPGSANVGLVLLIMAGAGLAAFILLWFWGRLFGSLALGLSAFVIAYLGLGITEKSLRLTTLLAAWLIYLLIVALRKTHPRPEDPPPQPLSGRHVGGLLVVLALGVLNDPLFALMAPALLFGLWLARPSLNRIYWGLFLIVTGFGIVTMVGEYFAPEWVFADAAALIASGQQVPVIVLTAWREPARWLMLTGLMLQQFTIIGVLLGVVGMARMARWYPTLGVVLMLLYGSYGVFGLTYFGGNLPILLLPMLMIQVLWMTYAVYAISQWLRQALRPRLQPATPRPGV